MTAKQNGKGSGVKIPRGYRLKAVTHNKIKELQQITGGSQDMVISRAVRLYSRKIQSKQ
jgi:hypothetical protein